MRACLAIALFGLLALTSGCGLGAIGEQSGDVSLTVTRDFGTSMIVHTTQPEFPERETVMRYTQRDAPDVETRYGGRFVESIDGIASGVSDGARSDWFYFVNGIEADKGAAERKLKAGDRVWWDYRNWDATMRVPAVVGSFPEPFGHGQEGKRYPVRVDCGAGSDEACDRVEQQLEEAGVAGSKAAIGSVVGEKVLRLVVGPWQDVRRDGASQRLEGGPAKSGVYVRPVAKGGAFAFELLDEAGDTVRTLGPGAGLVAATRFEEQAPTWVVTGTDEAGLDRAIALLTESVLRNRFALASDGRPIPLPVGAG